MPRKISTRPELINTGVLTNEMGVELGRITLNGIYILNAHELYFEIVRWAADHHGVCSINHLCLLFSRSGGWGYDASVYGTVDELVKLGVVEYATPDRKGVKPLGSINLAINLIPVYKTRAEIHAGLEEV